MYVHSIKKILVSLMTTWLKIGLLLTVWYFKLLFSWTNSPKLVYNWIRNGANPKWDLYRTVLWALRWKKNFLTQCTTTYNWFVTFGFAQSTDLAKKEIVLEMMLMGKLLHWRFHLGNIQREWQSIESYSCFCYYFYYCFQLSDSVETQQQAASGDA